MAGITCSNGINLSVEDIIRDIVDFTDDGITLNIRYISYTTVAAATYDLLTTDYLLHVTYTPTGTVAITLPTAQVISGRRIFVNDAGLKANTNNITISTEGAELIDGAATNVMNVDGVSRGFYCDGTNWFTL